MDREWTDTSSSPSSAAVTANAADGFMFTQGRENEFTVNSKPMGIKVSFWGNYITKERNNSTSISIIFRAHLGQEEGLVSYC